METMPNSEENKTEEATTEYEPPTTSWRALDFIKASLEEAQKKVVGCHNCPVNILCMEGEGGTGFVCAQCRSTGVWIDMPEVSGASPRDVLILDCAKHKFDGPSDKRLTRCVLCSGDLMRLEINGGKARNHLVFTEHAKKTLAERHAKLRERGEYWTEYYATLKTDKL